MFSTHMHTHTDNYEKNIYGNLNAKIKDLMTSNRAWELEGFQVCNEYVDVSYFILLIF